MPRDGGVALYRGWMLRAEHYAALCGALERRAVTMRTRPAAYCHTHHLPESYDVIAGHTPETVWLEAPFEPSPADAHAAVAAFAEVMVRVRSGFFAMDLARRVDGVWRIVELGDGQVSGLPDGLAPRRFYEALAEAFAQPSAP